MTQLLLIQPTRKPAAFGKLNAPFRDRYGWTDVPHCHAARFLYWESEMDCIVIAPMPCKVSFWKDEKTVDGELKTSIHGLPERERGRYATTDTNVKPAPRRRKQKRQSTRWSKSAIIRNRKRKLRLRIEKRFGYDPQSLHLFNDDLTSRIDAEYQKHLAANPDYYAGKRYN